MAKSRFEASLPDITHPVMLRRDLQISVGENGKTEWAQLIGVEVDQLARHVLYVPAEGNGQYARGEVWSRNLELTENGGGSIEEDASHRFARFRRGLYSALRTHARIPRQYVEGEIPVLTRQREQIHWLLMLAYRLRRRDTEQEELFENKAKELAKSFGNVRKEEKVTAKGRLMKASSIRDPRGVRNPGRLPPLFWSSDDLLEKCIRGDRSIARKVDFRAIVLADYLDQMMSLLRKIDRATVEKLSSKKLWDDRDRQLAGVTASNMRRFAQERLSHVHVRPFRRGIAHIASELGECATALESGELELARPLLNRIHRSIVLTTVHHRRLEGALMVVSDARQFKVPLHAYELFDLIELLRREEAFLLAREPITGEYIEEGFDRKVLPKIVPELREARSAITDVLKNGGKLDDAYEHLKAACDPL